MIWRCWPLAAVATLAACHGSPPRDCSTVNKQALECMGKFGSGHEREMLLACLPFSNSEKIEGTWYFGFEVNAFYEGAEIKKPAATLPGPVKTSLEYDPRFPNDGRLRVLQMQLVGRRSQCPITDGEHVIVVDRVVANSLKAVLG